MSYPRPPFGPIPVPTGVVPFYSAVPEPAAAAADARIPDAAPEEALSPDALVQRLEADRRDLLDVLRVSREGGRTPLISHPALALLNRDLARVKTLNAGRHRTKQSQRIAAWPEPVFPQGTLLGARDLLPVIGEALVCLAGVREGN